MHFAPHALHYMLLYHTCTFVLDPAEQEPEEPPETAQVKGTNPEQDQGKP
jgi:hypothetical protein